MREFFKNLYYHSDFGRAALTPFLKLRNSIFPQEILLKKRFKRMLGYELNLKNPKSCNEKIQWLKLNDRSPLHVKCADKFAVREYIDEKIGSQYLIPLIAQSKNAEEIVPEKLPSYPFIIKTNHDSGGVFIVRDKKSIDWSTVRKSLATQLNHDYNTTGYGEWQYSQIEPRVIVEKLLMDEEGNVPPDFKLYCFNGKVGIIQVDLDREKEHKRNLYDVEWNLLPFEWRYKKGRPVARPKVLDEMISVAEKLAEDFIFVRVDLYNIGAEIYFGELTFHSESGFGKFTPQEWDYKLGEMLRLPIA